MRISKSKVAAMVASAFAGMMASSALAVDTNFSGGTGIWNLDANWSQAGADTTYGTPDDVHIQPGAADAAIITSGQTVTLDSAETVLEAQIGYPGNAFDTSGGTARLNVVAGGSLTTSGNSSGLRIGRSLDAGATLGSSRGQVVQTGGSVIIGTGANGLRLSEADGGAVADSLYRVSGGSVRGGSGADGTMVSDLRVGAPANTYGSAEFHVSGSAATSIRFLDVRAAASSTAGSSTFHFSLDAGGVTPIVAEDEFQFRGVTNQGDNRLVIDMIGLAPQADVTLVSADRLTTNGLSAGSLEQFPGLAQNAPISVTFGGFTYNYLLVYTDGSDDGVLDASIVLDFQNRVAVPEPTTLAAVGLGGLLLRRRRIG